MFRNNRAFTLVEMLIVLMIIAVLIILIVPNLGEKGKVVQDKGCNALVSVVEAQGDAYMIENGDYPANITELVEEGYIKNGQTTCSDGSTLSYADGTVIVDGAN